MALIGEDVGFWGRKKKEEVKIPEWERYYFERYVKDVKECVAAEWPFAKLDTEEDVRNLVWKCINTWLAKESDRMKKAVYAKVMAWALDEWHKEKKWEKKPLKWPPKPKEGKKEEKRKPAVLPKVCLKKGSTGDNVVKLQRMLRDVSTLPQFSKIAEIIKEWEAKGKRWEDGIFGSKTKAALIEFQKVAGLPATGEVCIGDLTWQKLEEYSKKKAPKPAEEKPIWKKPWFWGAIGGGIILLILLLKR